MILAVLIFAIGIVALSIWNILIGQKEQRKMVIKQDDCDLKLKNLQMKIEEIQSITSKIDYNLNKVTTDLVDRMATLSNNIVTALNETRKYNTDIRTTEQHINEAYEYIVNQVKTLNDLLEKLCNMFEKIDEEKQKWIDYKNRNKDRNRNRDKNRNAQADTSDNAQTNA